MISIIIPTYNRASFIEECIESALQQTYKTIEVIVVDDGSTDNTRELVEKYDVTYIYQDHKNAAAAMNTGIKASHGRWIKLLGSDDVLLPDAISNYMKEVDSEECIYYADYKTFRMGTGKIQTWECPEYPIKDQHKEMLKSFYGGVSFIPKKLFEKYGYFDEDIIIAEDYDFWLRCTSHRVEMRHLPFIAEIVRLHPNRMSEQTPFADTNQLLRERYATFS